MENTFVVAFLFIFHLSPGGTYETYCSSGERLHTPRVGHDVCLPCHGGTFIAEENHFFRKCKSCTEIENPDVEVLVSACYITHDAVILCTGGFYRRRARNIQEKDRCEKCTECPFPARPCEGYYNTVCCPPNHDAVMAPDGVFVCKERPIVCGAGQFFRASSEECLLCPAGTFMPAHSHTYKDCLTCEELSENNLTQAVITRPCSRTAPTLFGCKAGYFRDPTQESLQIEVPCTPCRICNHSLTDCGMFHDAVCGDEDRMVSTAATNLTVLIGGEHARKNSPPETSVIQIHTTVNVAENTSQCNEKDSELATSTKCDFDWIKTLMYVNLLLVCILLLTLGIFSKKRSNLTANNTYYNMLHYCGQFKRCVSGIHGFGFVCLIVLSISQVLVIFDVIKLTNSALTAFVCTEICLAILVVAASVIIRCSKEEYIFAMLSKENDLKINSSYPGNKRVENVCQEEERMCETENL